MWRNEYCGEESLAVGDFNDTEEEESCLADGFVKELLVMF